METASFRDRLAAIERDRMKTDAEGHWDPPGWQGWTAGQLFRARRRFAGLTQRELARRAGTGQSDVCRVERGLETTLGTLRRLATALDCGLVLRLRPADASKPPVYRSHRLGPRKRRAPFRREEPLK